MFYFLQKEYTFSLQKKKKRICGSSWKSERSSYTSSALLLTLSWGWARVASSDVWCINDATYPSPPPNQGAFFQCYLAGSVRTCVCCPCHPPISSRTPWVLCSHKDCSAVTRMRAQVPGDASPEQITSDWSHPPVLSTPHCSHLSECSGEGGRSGCPILRLYFSLLCPCAPSSPLPSPPAFPSQPIRWRLDDYLFSSVLLSFLFGFN